MFKVQVEHSVYGHLNWYFTLTKWLVLDKSCYMFFSNDDDTLLIILQNNLN